MGVSNRYFRCESTTHAPTPSGLPQRSELLRRAVKLGAQKDAGGAKTIGAGFFLRFLAADQRVGEVRQENIEKSLEKDIKMELLSWISIIQTIRDP